MKIPVRTESGWQIDAILDTTYVATKDGESVTLEADTLEQMELLIALREGLVKHEDEPRATISMPDSFRYELAIEAIEDTPPADVKPVVRGEWIKLDMHCGEAQYKCSACGMECYVPECMYEPLYAFCPNCGAEMRKEVEE